MKHKLEANNIELLPNKAISDCFNICAKVCREEHRYYKRKIHNTSVQIRSQKKFRFNHNSLPIDCDRVWNYWNSCHIFAFQ